MTFIMKQKTISKAVTISGVGLHTGASATITLKPAEENHGIKFQRIDLPGKPLIPADCNRVTSTTRSTVIEYEGALVATIEHLLSAIYAKEIDNLQIEIDGSEVPYLDGSSKIFTSILNEAGVLDQSENKLFFEVEETIEFKDEESGAHYVISPFDGFEVTVLVDFNAPYPGQQFAVLAGLDKYEGEISPAKSFVLLKDIDSLMGNGLIKGGTLDNALVIADRLPSSTEWEKWGSLTHSQLPLPATLGVINKSNQTFENEPARHKLLDFIGDIALLGAPIKGRFIVHKPGHSPNNLFARVLKKQLQEQKKLRGKPKYDPSKIPVFNSVRLESWLPHRFPFLLLDKITELTDTYVVGVKNITVNEQYFQGHFPGNPVMPGVLQVEAMAQTGGILALSTVEDPWNWDTYFLKIDNAKFKAKVSPGDILLIKMELLSPIRRGICHMQGIAYVDNKIVSEAELTAQIIRRKVES
jgi:UDP-3-O-[3-hydroxymyristoyl] N-acetylglucosamine deacetylase/3-hydroxyacyl-[acyl-carrier-protein] dehydratase